jgi:DNA-binding transcriptional regulator YdaS (Cro superfamily)
MQLWLAERIGAQPSEVSDWVRGVHVPVPSTRQAIARALGRHESELWPDLERKTAA